MSLLPIYTYGTSVLRKKAKPVHNLTDELITLVRDMFETMHHASGIGLAANQVGKLQRIIVVDISEMEGYENEQPMVVINPQIISKEGDCDYEEGCLSIPNLRAKIYRAEKIKVKFLNTNLEETTIEADGLKARVLLHEIDHLNGVLFIEHLSKEEYKNILPQLREIEHGNVSADYEIVTSANKKKKKSK